MTWNVKEEFCSECAEYSKDKPTIYHYYPQLRVESERELTVAERKRLVDAIVKAASVEMIHINDDDEAIAAHNRVAKKCREVK